MKCVCVCLQVFFFGIRPGSVGWARKDVVTTHRIPDKELRSSEWLSFHYTLFVSSKFVLTILYMSIICCSWDAASYDSLLGSNKLFPQPIPLNVSILSHSLSWVHAIRETPWELTLLATDENRKWWIFWWRFGNKKVYMTDEQDTLLYTHNGSNISDFFFLFRFDFWNPPCCTIFHLEFDRENLECGSMRKSPCCTIFQSIKA